jgi:hypothetical protein
VTGDRVIPLTAALKSGFFLFWLGVVAASGLWFFVLPGRTGKLVALVGAIVAVLIVLAAVTPSSGREYVRRAWPAVLESPQGAALLLVPFLLPVYSMWSSPQIAFWRLDGRGWLLLAWLAVSGVLAFLRHWDRRTAHGPRDGGPPALAVSLFLLWTSVFWLTVVWDLGVGRFVMEVDRGRNGPVGCQADPLATTFATWETRPARDHLFVAWRSPQSFDAGRPYAHQVQPYLLSMYGWTAAVRFVAGVPLYVATNTTPFLSLFVLLAAATTLLARSGLLVAHPGPVASATLFLAYGFLITTWRFWEDSLRYSSDHPLLAAVLVFVFAFLLAPVRPALAMASAAAFAALSPIFTPMLVAAVLCAFGESAGVPRDVLARNRTVLRLSCVALAVAVVSYTTPWVLIRWRGYSPQASSFLFRSGLDGDTRYFTSIIQAIVAPCSAACCGGRPIADLLFPAFLPLAVFGLLWAMSDRRGFRLSVGRQLMFLCTPYLVSAVLFPQSVSIHPYLSDHLLLIPIVLTGVMSALTEPVQSRLNGVGLLAFLIFMAGLVMSNLTSLAQGLVRMLP